MDFDLFIKEQHIKFNEGCDAGKECASEIISDYLKSGKTFYDWWYDLEEPPRWLIKFILDIGRKEELNKLENI